MITGIVHKRALLKNKIMKPDTHNLTRTKNIGPLVAKRLHEVGIYTLTDLAVITPAKAYIILTRKFQGINLPVTLYLYALQGALMDIHWSRLPKRLQKELLDKVNKENK